MKLTCRFFLVLVRQIAATGNELTYLIDPSLSTIQMSYQSLLQLLLRRSNGNLFSYIHWLQMTEGSSLEERISARWGYRGDATYHQLKMKPDEWKRILQSKFRCCGGRFAGLLNCILKRISVMGLTYCSLHLNTCAERTNSLCITTFTDPWTLNSSIHPVKPVRGTLDCKANICITSVRI